MYDYFNIICDLQIRARTAVIATIPDNRCVDSRHCHLTKREELNLPRKEEGLEPGSDLEQWQRTAKVATSNSVLTKAPIN